MSRTKGRSGRRPPITIKGPGFRSAIERGEIAGKTLAVIREVILACSSATMCEDMTDDEIFDGMIDMIDAGAAILVLDVFKNWVEIKWDKSMLQKLHIKDAVDRVLVEYKYPEFPRPAEILDRLPAVNCLLPDKCRHPYCSCYIFTA